MTRRGQANLLALATALLLVTAAVVGAVVAAGGALAGVTGDPADRRAAETLAARLLDTDGPVAVEPNVLAAEQLRRLDAERLRDQYPAYADRQFAVRVGDTRLTAGKPGDGTTVRRTVLVATDRTVVRRPEGDRRIDLPNGTARATVTIDPGAAVTRVDAAGRTRYLNESGLVGTYDVSFVDGDPRVVTLGGDGDIAAGTAVVRCAVRETRPSTLVVTVDA